MRSHQKTFKITVLILLLITIFLHLKDFPDVPNGFFYDESSVAYNAFCVLKTGSDEYGNRYPVFFRCFDNFQDPVYVYSLVPLLSAFGLEIWVARLPGLLYKFAATIAIFFLLREFTSHKLISLFGAFIFSILPWTFVLGRTGIGGYMPMLLGIILSTYFSINFIRRNSVSYAILAGTAWAFTMYSHQIGRPMGAVLLFAFILTYNMLILKRLKYFAILLSTILICLIPMILYVFGTPESMTKRFSTFCIWGDNSTLFVVLGRFLSRYLEYFSPSFLFLSGDIDLRHNTNASGELYLFMVPFLFLGLWKAIRVCRKNPMYRFLVLAIIFYPLAASLTMDRMHSTRCLNGAPFFCILSIVGLKTAFALFRKKKFYFSWQIPLIAIFAIEAAFYMKNYFGEYAVLSRGAFNAPLVEIIETAFKERKVNEAIYVSSSLFHHPVDRDFKPVWYSHFLFFGKIDPFVYQKAGIPSEIISHYEPEKISKPGLLLRMNSKIIFDRNFTPMVVLNDEPIPDGAKLLRRICLTEGSDRFFELYRF